MYKILMYIYIYIYIFYCRCQLVVATWVHNILISLSGDVRLNAGPKNKSHFRALYMSLEVKKHNAS